MFLVIGALFVLSLTAQANPQPPEPIPSGTSGGLISPRKFVFHTVVPAKTPKEGGWKVACVNITFFDLGRPGVSWVCDTEVGIPERNFRGPILEREAQVSAAAAAADLAAHEVLSQGGPYIAAQVCIQFFEEMGKLFRAEIPGGKVNKFLLCNQHNIPPVAFP